MRLGHRDESRMLDCARAIADAGAAELVVHARTKVHGYRPPAYWDRIAHIREAVAIPVVANGEVWTVADALRCRAESGCDALMLGRGIVADPGLALALRGVAAPGWDAVRPLLGRYWRRIEGHVAPRHRAGRLKQWLNLLRRRFPEAQAAFDAVRTTNEPAQVERLLGFSRPAQDAGRPDAGGQPSAGTVACPVSAPDFLRDLDDQPQLGALRLDGDVVAVHGAAEAALG